MKQNALNLNKPFSPGKAFAVASVISAATLTFFTGCHSIAANSIETVVTAPFKVTDINFKKDLAEIETHDGLVLEVEFNANYGRNGNGYISWNDADVKELKDIRVYNEDGEVSKFYLDKEELSKLSYELELEIRDRL